MRPEPASAAPARRRAWRWRPRFSLRTLVIGVFLLGSGMGLWWRREPWEVRRTLKHTGVVRQVGFSPDGTSFFTCAKPDDLTGEPRTLLVWDSASGQEKLRVRRGRDSGGVAWGRPEHSPDSRWIMYDANVINVATGEELVLAGEPGHGVVDACFALGGRRLLYRPGQYLEYVRYRDLETGRDVSLDFPHPFHEGQSTSGNQQFALIWGPAADAPRHPRILNLETMREIPLQIPAEKGATSFVFSPDGKWVAVESWECPGDERNRTYVFGVESGKLAAELPVASLGHCWFSPDSRLLLVLEPWLAEPELRTERGRRVALFEVGTWRKRWVHERGFAPRMEPFSPDSRFALIADFTDASDHSVTSPAFISWHWKMDVWDLEQDAQTVSLERSSQLAYVSEEIEVRFSRDGSRVFCFPNGFVWDARTGKIVLEKPGDGAQLSQDEAKMLASDPRGALFLYDARTGERLALLSAQGNTISAFALSPDGTQVLTAQDKAAFFWARRRPEYWWGVAWLPEFWLTILFAGGLAWSVRRDRRTL